MVYISRHGEKFKDGRRQEGTGGFGACPWGE